MNNKIKALQKRMDRLTPEHLIVLTDDGQEMTVQEMINSGAGFERIVSGDNFHEFDMLLDYVGKSITDKDVISDIWFDFISGMAIDRKDG